MESKKTAVLGASSKEDRYSYQAMKLLLEYGHEAIPIHPKEEEVCGQKVLREVRDLPNDIDTLSVYVNPQLLEAVTDQIVAVKPNRVIMNPGSENQEVVLQLKEAGITVMEACTLVLLKTNQY